MKLVAYLAHPVGHGTDRGANIQNTKRWVAALVDATEWAICVPWLPYVETLDELTYRPRGIADDLACLERCDLCVLVGGRVSPGMHEEQAHAIRSGIPVVDLTSYGYNAPNGFEGPLATLRALAKLRSQNAIAALPRRVITQVSRADLQELYALRASAAWQAPIEVLNRIIAAAEVQP